MNIFVNQTITITSLKIGGVSNSSVLQIGTAGIIKATTHLYNTGGYKGIAPELADSPLPLIPLPPPYDTG